MKEGKRRADYVRTAPRLLDEIQKQKILLHFQKPESKTIRVKLMHFPEYSIVMNVWRNDLEPYYYWFDVKRVPHKITRLTTTLFESATFDSVKDLLED